VQPDYPYLLSQPTRRETSWAAKGHPELPQIPQLVDQQGGRRLATRQRPRHLTMRQAEFRRGNHICKRRARSPPGGPDGKASQQA